MGNGVKISSKIVRSYPIHKWCILPEFKAGDRFKPEAYREYTEDLNLSPNAEIG